MFFSFKKKFHAENLTTVRYIIGFDGNYLNKSQAGRHEFENGKK
jgi:hypothetical protein